MSERNRRTKPSPTSYDRARSRLVAESERQRQQIAAFLEQMQLSEHSILAVHDGGRAAAEADMLAWLAEAHGVTVVDIEDAIRRREYVGAAKRKARGRSRSPQ